jgi:hypothetical protein
MPVPSSDPQYLSASRTDYLGDVVNGKRAVFYEEMAQWGQRYLDQQSSASPTSDMDAECRYHINNLTLLSMYFNIIFIQTACIFNTTDSFLKGVIQKTISHPKFRSMVRMGTVRICGWGGTSPREMFGNALNYASATVNLREPDGYLRSVSELFRPDATVFRTSGYPDDEIAAEFRHKLLQTTVVRHADDLDRIDRAVELSQHLTGQLTAMGFLPALDLRTLRPDTKRAVINSFVSVSSSHLNNAIPGIHNYLIGFGPLSIYHTVNVGGKQVRSFLYAPSVFAVFLRHYFTLSEYNTILGRPYEELERLRNGDWKRFCDAYHRAIEEVSDEIANIDSEALPIFDLSNESSWGRQIWQESTQKAGEYDVNAFLEGLASLSGILLGMPFIGPVVKVVGVFLKRRLNSIPQKLLQEHRNAISPYIKKVRISLRPQLSEA